MGGPPLAQRLHDKPADWGGGGLGSLIPESIAQGLIGHPFVCPDMVGGGDLAYFPDGGKIDQELFVRYAQCAALFPMMQFSLAPWRCWTASTSPPCWLPCACAGAVPEIGQCPHAADRRPILRPLAYHHPGYEHVQDQFLLGEDILCAPVLEASALTLGTSPSPAWSLAEQRWLDPRGPGGPRTSGHPRVAALVGEESVHNRAIRSSC